MSTSEETEDSIQALNRGWILSFAHRRSSESLRLLEEVTDHCVVAGYYLLLCEGVVQVSMNQGVV